MCFIRIRKDLTYDVTAIDEAGIRRVIYQNLPFTQACMAKMDIEYDSARRGLKWPAIRRHRNTEPFKKGQNQE